MPNHTNLTKLLRYSFVLVCSVILFATGCKPEKEELLQVGVDLNETAMGATPVALDISTSNLNDVVIIEKRKGGTKEIPSQIDGERLWFQIAPYNANDKAEYFIKKRKDSVVRDRLTYDRKDGDLNLKLGDKPVLTYRYGMTYPPLGVDSIFRKSGYIHPVLAPNGDTLSRIQPPDHYHHYGIWGPWTHTQIKGQQVDFWNLGDRKGTVLFKEFNNTTAGAIFTSFNAAQEHIDFITEKEPQVALNEDLEVKLWGLNRPDRYMFDYKSTFTSPLENGILFEAYRYGGGIGMRFNQRWKADNCSVLTSEGKDRLEADGTNARWCIVSGISTDGKGTNGILFMSHPNNRMHPEPMRIWPMDANEGRGDMFFEFCPIRHEEWQIEPNKAYELNYRMVVFDGKLSAEEAETYWQLFANPPVANIMSK